MARWWIAEKRIAGELFSNRLCGVLVAKCLCSYSMPTSDFQSCRAAHTTRPVIEFRDVNKWFGPLHVLKDINLKIGAGEVVVVCGPSGSGKSTLIRCINRLEPIQSGE